MLSATPEQGAQAVQLMQWFLWVVIPLLGVLAALTPYLMPKRECFAVTIPDSAQHDPCLRGFKRRYLTSMLILTAALSVVSAVLLANHLISAFIVVCVVGMIALMLISYTLMLFFRAKVKKYKKAKGWKNEKDRNVSYVGYEDFPKPLSMKWCWIYVPIIVVVGLIGIIGYPAMPDMVSMHLDIQGNETDFQPKSYALVAFPVAFCIFIAIVMTFSQWSIVRSKKANDPSMPAASLWAYGMFARAQSMLLVVMGLSMTALFGILLQLSMIGAISIVQAVLPMIVALVIIMIASTAVNLVYGQNGSRLIARMSDSGEMLRDNDEYWKLGIFYCNPNDPSLFLSERFGIGWTMNFSRPAVWTILAALVAVIIVFVVLCFMLV